MSIFKKFLGKQDQSEAKAPASPPPSPPEPEPLLIQEIQADDLKNRLEAGEGLTVIDLRQSWEYTGGHIPGAISLPIMELPRRRDEVPKDRLVVMQCYHGISSLDAAGYLIENGWEADKIISLAGGMSGWAMTHGIDSLEKEA
jgi:rhodanese-related sulfurtransferase